MGGLCSTMERRAVYTSTYLNSFTDNASGNGENEDALPRFQILKSHHEAVLQYTQDESVPVPSLGNARMIEMRTLLGDKISFDIIVNYAKKLKRAEGAKKKLQLNVFPCWNDIWQLRKAAAADSQFQSFQKAKDIYIRYVRKKDLIISDELLGYCAEYFELPETKRANNKNTPVHYLLPIFYFCFAHIYECVYAKFVHSHEYADMNKYLRDNINCVDINDFKLLSLLGEGSCGVVLECVKRTTNVGYALKIIRKKALINRYSRKPLRIDDELRAAVALRNNPYIVNVAYAMTTSSVAMLALELCVGVDMKLVLSSLPNGRLADAHCRFYAAEIVSALSYMHSQGFVYRGLKPGNIMLLVDGHIKLVDLGSCQDLERDDAGSLVSKNSTKEHPLTTFNSPFNCPLLANISSPSSSTVDHVVGGSRRAGDNGTTGGSLQDSALGEALAGCSFVRAKSIVGTLGYLAPELMLQYGHQVEFRTGYSHASDWWSLGALLYRMYTGHYPYAMDTGMIGMSIVDNLAKKRTHLGKMYGRQRKVPSDLEYSLVNEEEFQPAVPADNTAAPVDFLSIGGTLTMHSQANSQHGQVESPFAVMELCDGDGGIEKLIQVKAMAYTCGHSANPSPILAAAGTDCKEAEEPEAEEPPPPAYPEEIFAPDAANFIMKCLEFDDEKRWVRPGDKTSFPLSSEPSLLSLVGLRVNATRQACQEVMAHCYFDEVPEFSWDAVNSRTLSPPELPVDVEALRAELVAKTASMVQSTKRDGRPVAAVPAALPQSLHAGEQVSPAAEKQSVTLSDTHSLHVPASSAFDRTMVSLGRKDWLISDLNLGAVPLDTCNFNPNYKVPKVTNLNEYMFTTWSYINPAVVRLEQSAYCPSSSSRDSSAASNGSGGAISGAIRGRVEPEACPASV